MQWISQQTTEAGPVPPAPGSTIENQCHLCGLNLAFIAYKLVGFGCSGYVCPTCHAARDGDSQYIAFKPEKVLVEGGSALGTLCHLIPAMMRWLPVAAMCWRVNLMASVPEVHKFLDLDEKKEEVFFEVDWLIKVLFKLVQKQEDNIANDRLEPFLAAKGERKKFVAVCHDKKNYFQISFNKLVAHGCAANSNVAKFVTKLVHVKDVLNKTWPDTAFQHAYTIAKHMLFVCLVIGQGGTGLHVDLSPGVNVAFALSSKKRQADADKLACWLFFKPSKRGIEAIKQVMASEARFNNHRFMAPPLVHKGKHVWRGMDEEIKAMNCFFHTLAPEDMHLLEVKCPQYVFTIIQKHGDVLRFGAGFMHAVYNMQPNIKVAFDTVAHADLPAMAVSYSVFGSGLMAQRNAEDYVSAPRFGMFDLFNILNTLT